MTEDNKALKYLLELMYYIHATHIDMSGNHRYRLDQRGYKLVSEIKTWLSEEEEVVSDVK
jgi:hypothetical protein